MEFVGRGKGIVPPICDLINLVVTVSLNVPVGIGIEIVGIETVGTGIVIELLGVGREIVIESFGVGREIVIGSLGMGREIVADEINAFLVGIGMVNDPLGRGIVADGNLAFLVGAGIVARPSWRWRSIWANARDMNANKTNIILENE